MTQWTENPEGGRDRGPVALARAWVEVVVRPTRFFETGVAPGDQAPGLVFAMVVVLFEEAIRFALVPDAYPVVAGSEALSATLWLALAVLLVTPAALHLIAALQTLILMPLASRRAGVSETVQVVGYASAPCLFAGVPDPRLRALLGIWAGTLLVLGLMVRHDLHWKRAALAGAIPASLAFGLGFRAFDAIGVLLRQWYII
ncbi:YIP1 family protein [Haloarchaeobius amylolyticus]|uniref:YIP1 family protein n=1 Tax=Haloarchaeobius amylolyticus TaxID=1198296 RepID=UPI002271967F|nr:YIP1 family protein [Haloarchaeobius amylolyticus]